MPCPLVRAFVMAHGMEGDHPADLGATTREALLSGNLLGQQPVIFLFYNRITFAGALL